MTKFKYSIRLLIVLMLSACSKDELCQPIEVDYMPACRPGEACYTSLYIIKNNCMQLKKYVIKKGKQDTSPPTIPTLFNFKGAFLKAKKLRWAYRVDESWWYAWRLANGTIDKDRNDYWKILGVSAGLTKPMNHEAVILACHPDGDEANKLIRFTIYRNFDGGKFDVAENESRSWTVPLTDETVRICEMYKTNPKSDILDVVIRDLDGVIERSFEIKFPFDSGKTIFCWFGGENNSEGQYGGVTSQDIFIHARAMHF